MGQKRFRRRTVRRSLPWLVILGGISIWAFVALAIHVLYPFQTLNPLYHEATIGEPVIDDWKYGGEDEEGYLRFYNGGETIVEPPSAHTFDADGRFVVIEGHSPGTLTYAQPYEAIPLPWLAGGMGVVALLTAAAVWRRKRLRRKFGRTRRFARSPLRQPPRQATSVSSLRSGRPKRFRPRRTGISLRRH